jgi:cold-inducible RNA-binding protein
MSTKLFVGNLSFDISEEDLREKFSEHGPVNEINVIKDRMTGRSRGFAFVTMNSEEGAKAVVTALHGTDWKSRALTVNVARPREGGGNGASRS